MVRKINYNPKGVSCISSNSSQVKKKKKTKKKPMFLALTSFKYISTKVNTNRKIPTSLSLL